MTLDLLPVWQLWLGRPFPASRACERTVQAVYSEERGYQYRRIMGDFMPPEIAAIRNRINRPPLISDLMRMWLLREYGGIWFDSDVIARKEMPFKSILLERPEVLISVCHAGSLDWFTPGLMACLPGNPYIVEAYDLCMRLVMAKGKKLRYSEAGPELITLLMRAHRTDWVILPQDPYAHECTNNRMQWQYRRPFKKTQRLGIEEVDWSYAHMVGVCLKQHQNLNSRQLWRSNSLFVNILRYTFSYLNLTK